MPMSLKLALVMVASTRIIAGAVCTAKETANRLIKGCVWESLASSQAIDDRKFVPRHGHVSACIKTHYDNVRLLSLLE